MGSSLSRLCCPRNQDGTLAGRGHGVSHVRRSVLGLKTIPPGSTSGLGSWDHTLVSSPGPGTWV